MSSDLLTNIKELLIFYVKTNYESYLQEKKITSIPEAEVSQVVRQIYNLRKDHSKVFVKDSLKQVLKTEYRVILKLSYYCVIFMKMIVSWYKK